MLELSKELVMSLLLTPVENLRRSYQFLANSRPVPLPGHCISLLQRFPPTHLSAGVRSSLATALLSAHPVQRLHTSQSQAKLKPKPSYVHARHSENSSSLHQFITPPKQHFYFPYPLLFCILIHFNILTLWSDT
jgi:hypothetical protein